MTDQEGWEQYEAKFSVYHHEKNANGLVPVMDAEMDCVCWATPTTADALCAVLNKIATGPSFTWDNKDPLRFFKEPK